MSVYAVSMSRLNTVEELVRHEFEIAPNGPRQGEIRYKPHRAAGSQPNARRLRK